MIGFEHGTLALQAVSLPLYRVDTCRICGAWPLTPRATSNNMRIQHISISKLDSYTKIWLLGDTIMGVRV